MREPTDRIERLREHALIQEEIKRLEPDLLWARSWLASSGEPWTIVRRGQTTADVLDGMTPVIDPDELIVGKFCPRDLTAEEQAELDRWNQYGEPARAKENGQRAHMAIDFEKLLKLGVEGTREQIAFYRSRLDISRPDDQEQDAFYRACLLTLDALVGYSLRHAELAERMADAEENEARREELRKIAEVCRQVPARPARTFWEAAQCAHFVTFCLCSAQKMLLFQLGRPDRYLMPFYRRDIASGILTPEAAQELVDCLGLMLCEYTPRGLAVGFMIGGRDSTGADVSNELTEMFLESIAHTRLSYPGIGLCWNSETPSHLLEKGAALLAQGLSHPAIFNDDVITAGMLQAGLPPGEACLYQNSTCVEITPIASSNVYVASPYINLLQLLHDLLGVPSLESGREAHPQSHPSFDALMTAYRAHLAEVIRDAVAAQNVAQASRRYNGGFPLLSCFVNDCLARGKDIDHGGARYNWIEPSFVGLSNLADSLTTIRRFVFEEEMVGMEELVTAMANDFEGREDLRQMLTNRAPKYGNDDDTVDALAIEVTGWIREEVKKYSTYLGGAFHPGLFCWVMHEHLGRVTCASPDGRRAGFPLGDGSGPAQGRERNGPTAAVLSATKWDHSPMLGGIAVNLKFSQSGANGKFVQKLADLIETYMQRGGFEIQINVVDRETLLAAREHPDEYRDLVVRIGGYSDYFVGLSPEMQAEVILRTEHDGI